MIMVSAAMQHPSSLLIRDWAKAFAKGMGILPAFLTTYRPYISPFEHILAAIPAPSSVFDIGCGAGLLLFLIHKDGHLKAGYGVDVSTGAIASAQHSHQTHGTGAKFSVAEQVEKWPAEQFDVITMIDVMHHIPPEVQKCVFDAACAKVNVGGRFIYKDMMCRPLFFNLANRLHDLVIARQIIHYVPIATIENWARENGLTLIKQSEHILSIYGHELRVFKRQAAHTNATGTNHA